MVAQALWELEWACEHVTLDSHHIQPGKPIQNAFIEASTASCAMSV